MKRCLIAVAAALSLAACSKSSYELEYPGSQAVRLVPHDEIVLGKHLDNPYTVENMTKALASLYPTKAGRVKIEPTDLYVRFLPLGDEQYRMLQDMGVEMLDHPMDYEILREGDYYHDPEVEAEGITWQYAVVPKDFEFPEGINYEKLQDCYLSENDPGTKVDGFDWEEIEREAFRLTGNAGMLSEPLTKGGGVVPQGRICIVDDRYPSEPIGVKGVMVSCNVFIKFGTAYTDENGFYRMNKSFSNNPRYRLVFKNRKGFGIGFNLILIPASISTLGKESPEGLSCTIDRTMNSALFTRSVVNNAAYEYYDFCSEDGLVMKTPPADLRLWLLHLTSASSSIMLHHGAIIDNSIIGKFLGQYAALVKIFLPDITIGVREWVDYASIYADTVHECAHASHYAAVGNDYWDSLEFFELKAFVTSGGINYGLGVEEDHGICEVAEMWAYYVETLMYSKRYPDEGRVFGGSFWFYPQIFSYLDERGLSRFKIFRSLEEGVDSRETLQSSLLSLYPSFKSSILQAFSRYQ